MRRERVKRQNDNKEEKNGEQKDKTHRGKRGRNEGARKRALSSGALLSIPARSCRNVGPCGVELRSDYQSKLHGGILSLVTKVNNPADKINNYK